MVKPRRTIYNPPPDRTDQLTGVDGASFAAHFWLAEPPRGAVLLLHGLAEPARRYAPFCNPAVQAGYTIAANDYRGHGDSAQSFDLLGQVGEDSWNATIQDSQQLLNSLQTTYPDLPIFIVGYSIGVMLALRLVSLAETPLS